MQTVSKTSPSNAFYETSQVHGVSQHSTSLNSSSAGYIVHWDDEASATNGELRLENEPLRSDSSSVSYKRHLSSPPSTQATIVVYLHLGTYVVIAMCSPAPCWWRPP